MDRVTAYSGALIAETDPLKAQQNAMIALGWASQSALGTATAVDGFGLTPTTPASLVANLAPGAIYQVASTEATVWSSLPANSASLVKQGLMLAVDPITFTPPSTTGFSQAFLIEAQYADLDTSPVLLPYYNAANPTQPYSGPGGSGTSQNTARLGIAAIQVKSGVASSSTPAIPTPDAGWIGLYVVTLAAGATSVTSGNIAVYSGAPFIPVKLPGVPAGVQAGQWLYGTDTGTAGQIATALTPTPTTLPDGMEIHIRALNAAAGADAINVSGLGSFPIKRRGGLTPASGDWASGDILTLRKIGSVWQMAGLVPSDVVSLISANAPMTISNPILYVRTDGNDSNNGLTNSSSGAFATIAAAIAYGAKRYYLAGGTLTIKLGLAGTYAAPGNITGVNGTVAILGDAANQSTYIIQGAGPAGGSSGLVTAYACQVTITGARIYNTGTINSSVNSFLGGSWTVNNVDFVSNSQSSNFAHMAVGTAGSGFLGQGCTITGGLGYAINASSGIVQIGPYTTIVQGAPNFPGAFVIAGSLAAVVTTGGASFSGSATGARFYVSNLALISAGGGGANFFPGNTAGAQVNASGGYYAN